jgi:predicted HTH transcriptional regulator
MPSPREVFDDPQKFWSFLTASDDAMFEGQFFERKEAGRVNSTTGAVKTDDIQEQIVKTVSAFANANREGSLLVVGIGKNGAVAGLSLLSDQQRRTLFDLGLQLRNHLAQVKFYSLSVDDHDRTTEIALVYVPEARGGICERPNREAHAWERHGNQNVPLSADRRDQLRRDKHLTSFENEYCCSYDVADIDRDVLQAFRTARQQEDDANDQTDEEFLYHCGALLKTREGLAFNNAGYLFFGANPQRILSASYVRLMKFETLLTERQDAVLPTADRSFRGSIVRQIRDLRAFFRGSSFFKVYQKRSDSGGFIDDPEYPYISIDEAIVNAVAHRDYALNYATECRYHRDAFIVSNAGRLRQRDHDVPNRFSLGNTQLFSTPRNAKVMDWLRTMRDKDGAAFVQALSEGTRKMNLAMKKASLPPPSYEVTEAQTTLTLISDAPKREALLRLNTGGIASTEYANLYPLMLVSEQLDTAAVAWEPRRKEITAALRGSLEAHDWFIDRSTYGRIVAHRRKSEFNTPANVRNVLRLFPSYSMQLKGYYGQPHLCLDYGVEVKSVLHVQKLLRDFGIADLVGLRVLALWRGNWQNGKLVAGDNETSKVLLFDFQTEASIPSSQVLPSLPMRLIDRIVARHAPGFDLHKEVKRLSLSSEPNAARSRAQKTETMAILLAETIFPLRLNDSRVLLAPMPTPLNRHEMTEGTLPVYGLPEPEVEFSHHHSTSDIRAGITKFGAFEQGPKTIEIVPVCLTTMQSEMASLIERIKTGKYQYKGSERTFRTRLTYSSIITAESESALLDQCSRMLCEHPLWCGNESLDRIFLVHTPEQGYALDDEQAPYYRIKRLLLEAGIPCQMVDSPTLQNPDWKDLNLALNITAKCGITPWVLPDAVPDADVFIGLSYTQSARAAGSRYMGYANVFNQFGQWQFYSGSSNTFAYEERATRFGELLGTTLQRIPLGPTPSVYFHYSAKFSTEDRDAILQAARSIYPEGHYTFVWINSHHTVRLYDVRAETDGSLPRGNYVVGGKNQFYLSTTGHNPYRKGLGTPHMLEINTWSYGPEGEPAPVPDLRALATQVLSLTKLNWASTDALCGEPITIKYASDIAYLTAAFLRQGTEFRLHRVLEKTPWFI